jgi:hypothetical protein
MIELLEKYIVRKARITDQSDGWIYVNISLKSNQEKSLIIEKIKQWIEEEKMCRAWEFIENENTEFLECAFSQGNNMVNEKNASVKAIKTIFPEYSENDEFMSFLYIKQAITDKMEKYDIMTGGSGIGGAVESKGFDLIRIDSEWEIEGTESNINLVFERSEQAGFFVNEIILSQIEKNPIIRSIRVQKILC